MSQHTARGYANGYIGLPPEHPWFNVDYPDIAANVHGGLTYSEKYLPNYEPDGLWWLGFDTNHWGDTLQSCPKSYCEAQLNKLLAQAQLAAGEPTTNNTNS
jgi:hypothetical protein